MRPIFPLLLAAPILGAAPTLAAPPEALIAAAKAEGTLTLIGYSRDWCGYGDAIDAFKSQFGLSVTELDPNATAGEELEALRANRNNTGPQAPDAIEVGNASAIVAREEGLLLPYKVSRWDEIDAKWKDPDGYWYGDMFGLMSFETNAHLIKNPPADWPDLLKPEYAHSVALTNDPRTSNIALLGIYAAGLSATGGDTAKAPQAGLDFFAELNRVGNFVPAKGAAAALAQGTTPIIIRWDFLGLADKDALAGNPDVTVVIPKTGAVVGLNTFAISAHAPHPNAGKLWAEFLTSEESALNFIKHHCRSVQFDALSRDGKISPELLSALPPASPYSKAYMPTVADLAAMKKMIVDGWANVIGAAK